MFIRVALHLSGMLERHVDCRVRRSREVFVAQLQALEEDAPREELVNLQAQIMRQEGPFNQNQKVPLPTAWFRMQSSHILTRSLSARLACPQ